MTTGEIIFAVMVAIHGLLFLIGLGYFIAFIKSNFKKCAKFAFTALIIWAISPLFSIVGACFGYFL